MERHEGNPGEEGANVLISEAFRDDVKRRRTANLQHPLAPLAPTGAGGALSRRPRRIFTLVVDDRRHSLPVVEQLTVCLGIGLREASELGASAIEGAPHGEAPAVAKWHAEPRVGE